MRTIERSAAFRKDIKRESKGPNRTALNENLPKILKALATDETLPATNKDHALIGGRAGYRECHIKPDLLLIYKKPDENTLYLARIGSHSELFKG